MDNEQIVILPIPSLISIIVSQEREKGSPLTESEVVELANNCACIAVPLEVAQELEKSRGYSDIDPNTAWESWLEVRADFFPAYYNK